MNSSVPLFIGFVQAGVPLGVTFSFLITAPMVDTVALTLLFSLFGWQVALLYQAFGMLLGVVAGLVLGAGIHAYVPQDFLASVMGRDAAWWSVPLAVLVGLPMYANTAGILPVMEALTAKGATMGTALAFMMSVVALSLPEMIILRKVLTLRLIAVFVAIVATGILAAGFLFNAIL